MGVEINEMYFNIHPKINEMYMSGNGGVGTIRIYHFAKGILSMDIAIDRVEAVDEEKLFYSVTMIQGPVPLGVIEIQDNLTFSATADGAGTIIKRKADFYTTSDTRVNETEIPAFNERAAGIFKAFEAYFLVNPNS